MQKKRLIFGLTLLTLIAFSGCGSSNSDSSGTEDTSASGTIASAIGGAYNGSSSSGTQATNQRTRIENLLASLDPVGRANASNACPTFTSLQTCITNGSQTLTYSNCSFQNSSATWNGGASLTCSSSLGSPTITRAFSTPTTRTNGFGTVVTIKDSGTLTTFNGTVSGGGTTLTPTSLNIGGVEFTATGSAAVSALFDHVITTSSPLSISGGVVNGTVTIYHNYAKVIGTAQLTNVGFSAGCCTPTSGSIRTTFQAYGIFAAKSGFNGASETLSFTGCGTATYSGPEGYSGSVTLSNCF